MTKVPKYIDSQIKITNLYEYNDSVNPDRPTKVMVPLVDGADPAEDADWAITQYCYSYYHRSDAQCHRKQL